jgi:peptide-methionine (R)-S-oxide reductase
MRWLAIVLAAALPASAFSCSAPNAAAPDGEIVSPRAAPPASTSSSTPQDARAAAARPDDASFAPIEKTDAEWRRELTPEQYAILREKGTEPPFTGLYVDSEEPGIYRCAGCGAPLFASDAKYHSGTGWPSFFRPIDPARIHTEVDTSHGMRRIEVSCARCGGHLGHVFDDGPPPTGLRYCIDSAALSLDRR